MTMTTLTLPSPADGLALAVTSWPAPPAPRGVVQLLHGLAEHGSRYDRLAQALGDAGYIVYAQDHRGHGASVSDAVPLGSFGAAGWAALIDDVRAVREWITTQNPGLPLFLIAHSMGSFAAQNVLLTDSAHYAGVVLSGTSATDVMAAGLDPRVGLAGFNAGFEPRTGFEWLSRDEAEVDAYVADPLCGFETAPETLPSLFAGADRTADPELLGGIRSDLPVLLVSGSDDPLAQGGSLIELVGSRYRDAGLTDVTVEVFPGARHEVFNETNRDEVTRTVLDWLAAHRS